MATSAIGWCGYGPTRSGANRARSGRGGVAGLIVDAPVEPLASSAAHGDPAEERGSNHGDTGQVRRVDDAPAIGAVTAVPTTVMAVSREKS